MLAKIRSGERTIRRDIFRPNLDFFELIEVASKVETTATTNPAADEAQKRQKIIRRQATELILRSTFLSERSTAIINDKVVRIDDEIEGFRIIGIHVRACDVEKEGFQYRIIMKE